MATPRQLQRQLYGEHLTTAMLLEKAANFAEHTKAEPITIPNGLLVGGTNIGDEVERRFKEYLQGEGLIVPSGARSGADFAELNIDLKCLQFGGRRGGAAKIHGYSKTDAPPGYDLLIFGYRYVDGAVTVTDVFFIRSSQCGWVQARHFLCTFSRDQLDGGRIF